MADGHDDEAPAGGLQLPEQPDVIPLPAADAEDVIDQLSQQFAVDLANARRSQAITTARLHKSAAEAHELRKSVDALTAELERTRAAHEAQIETMRVELEAERRRARKREARQAAEGASAAAPLDEPDGDSGDEVACAAANLGCRWPAEEHDPDAHTGAGLPIDPEPGPVPDGDAAAT